LFSRTHEAKKHSAVFIDRAGTCAIVVPMHYNGKGGFLFEDDRAHVFRPLPDAEALGTEIFAAMERSQIKPETSHRGAKLTDWPAFKASGARSVKRFEADFIRVHVAGANEANIIYQLEGLPEKDAELRILASSNPRPPDRLGERCLAVWRACRDRSI